jgi:methyltransferase (TIGR00027 family)
MTSEWDIASGIGITALAVAEMRARSRSLAEDRFASAFVRAAGQSMPVEESTWEFWTRYLSVRTRFYDDYLATEPTQVVLLGAGLDARAFRLPWPSGCVLYELDQPEVLRFKQLVLDQHGHRPRCRRVPVACDLRGNWAEPLQRTGFDPEQATAWLAEGLLPYLPSDAENALFDTVVALSAPASTIAFDLPPANNPGTMIVSPVFRALIDGLGVDIGQEWQNDARSDNVHRLRERGWRITAETFTSVSSRYGCPLPADPVVGQGTLLVGRSTGPADRRSPTRIGGATA